MQKLFENWRRYLTEEQLLKEEQVKKYIMESDIEHLWENNNYERLDESVRDWLETGAHTLLDILGVVADPAGGAGAIFDGINALWYAHKKCWLYAAFSLISMAPAVGDAIGKGGKILVYIKKGVSALKKLKIAISANREIINKIFDAIENGEKTPKKLKDAIPQIKDALGIFVDDPTAERPSCGASQPPAGGIKARASSETPNEKEELEFAEEPI